ncbi:MAG TPA: hypothetical protein VF491_06885 [Vicinamibacterales bacterium]|jgi:hypothetical protein
MAGKDKKSKGDAGESDVEQGVVALAQQIGWFLGKVQKRADGWLENETLQQQVAQMRDGAIELLGHVTRASAGARDVVSKAVDAAKAAAQQADADAAARPAPKAKAAKGTSAEKKSTTPAVAPQARASRGAVDAPGKKHRKPPPQEKIDRHMGEPAGKKAGQKSFRVGKSRGRG